MASTVQSTLAQEEGEDHAFNIYGVTGEGGSRAATPATPSLTVPYTTLAGNAISEALPCDTNKVQALL